MQRVEATVSIVIFTEDTSADGRATIEALVRRMLRLMIPDCRLDRVAFLPDDPREREQIRRLGGTVRELAEEGYPAQTALDVKKSLAESIQRLKDCVDLRSALLRTHQETS